MAALPTSFLYRGVELNDGTIYSIPLREQTLDDRQSVETSWAYRKGDTPLPAARTLKEGVFALNINIVARHGETPAQYEAKLDALKKLFDTRDGKLYPLYRKFAHEQYHRFLMVTPVEVTINRIERRVTVTLQTPDRSWEEEEYQAATFELFNGSTRDHFLTVNYDGLVPVEPIVELTALTLGTDGPVPLYFHEVDVYTAGAAHVVGTPILVADNWNTASYVVANQMRADGLDITVTLPDGTTLWRNIHGTQSARRVWIRPTAWPDNPDIRLDWPPGYNVVTQAPLVQPGDTSVYIRSISARLDTFLKPSDTICIGDELITYNGFQVLANNPDGGQRAVLQNCARGQQGTTAAAHYDPSNRAAVKFRTTLRVNYGYAGNYKATHYWYHGHHEWPLIDYEVSTNTWWRQIDATTSPDATTSGPTSRPLSWFACYDITQPVYGEFSTPATVENRAALGGGILPGYGGQGYRWRLACKLYPFTSRAVGKVEMNWLRLRAGDGQFPTVKADFRRVSDAFGTAYERSARLLEFTQASGVGELSSSELWVGQADGPGATHLTVSFTQLPTDSTPNDTLRAEVRRVTFHLDTHLGKQIVTRFNTTQRGLGTGEFPVVVNWVNNSDVPGAWFTAFPRLTVNATVRYHCDTYTVEGEPLANCTYDRVTWLRLLPGANQIHVSGPPGVGRVQMRILWKRKM